MKGKGARLTTDISLPGRFVVFVPNGEGFGVSRRLEDDERIRLRDILKEIAPKQGRATVRTAAEALRRRTPSATSSSCSAFKADRGDGEDGQGRASSTRRPSCRSASCATSSPRTSARSLTTSRSNGSSAT